MLKRRIKKQEQTDPSEIELPLNCKTRWWHKHSSRVHGKYILLNILAFCVWTPIFFNDNVSLPTKWLYFSMIAALNIKWVASIIDRYQGVLKLFSDKIGLKRFGAFYTFPWTQIAVIECPPDSESTSKLLLLCSKGWTSLHSTHPGFQKVKEVLSQRIGASLQENVRELVPKIQESLKQQEQRRRFNRWFYIACLFFWGCFMLGFIFQAIFALNNDIDKAIYYLHLPILNLAGMILLLSTSFHSLYKSITAHPNSLSRLLGYQKFRIAVMAKTLLESQDFSNNKKGLPIWPYGRSLEDRFIMCNLPETKEIATERLTVCKALILGYLASLNKRSEEAPEVASLDAQDHQALQNLLLRTNDKIFLCSLLQALETLATAEYLPVLKELLEGKGAVGEDESICADVQRCLNAIAQRTQNTTLLRGSMPSDEHLLRISSAETVAAEELLRAEGGSPQLWDKASSLEGEANLRQERG